MISVNLLYLYSCINVLKELLCVIPFLLSLGEENMNIDKPLEYSQKRAIIDSLYKEKLITFMEWYNILLDLRKQYNLVFIK